MAAVGIIPKKYVENQIITTISTAIGGALLYTFNNEIKQGIIVIGKFIIDQVSCTLSVPCQGNEKTVYAIHQEISKTYVLSARRQKATDGLTIPNYEIANGTYIITFNGKYIFISLEDKEITIKAYGLFIYIGFLKSFLNEIYKKHASTDKVIMFYISQSNSWKYPIYRRPRNNMQLTNDMKGMLSDIQKFYTKSKEIKYEQNGKPYRRGYMIIGAAGTGKSSMVEIIAQKYDMTIYSLNLNSNGMDDTILINLVTTIPYRTILVLDEFDKQYDAIQNNKNINLSSGAILSALDGTQRLSHGTMVIIIANNIDNIDVNLTTPLLRKGRIDKKFVFTERLT